MAESGPRFEFFPDPAGDWMIWDNAVREPAMFSNIVLTGLSGTEAESLCGLLNGYIRAERELSRRGG